MLFQKPPKLFIAYAHEDEKYRKELTIRLEPLKQERKIEVWHYGELIPGDKWRDVRDHHLKNANVVLYLASPYSLASVECNKEIADALDNKKLFIPIILRECDWKNYKISGSSISDFQALPKDGKPVKSWKDKDKAWQDVIDGIHKILDTERKQEDAPQSTPFELGNAKYMLGALDEALANYNKAIELKPDFAEAYNNRSVLFSNLKQYDKAEMDYNKAIELKPNYADAYNNRGVLFSNLKQYDKAEMDYNKAIELKPNYADAYNNRGVLFSNLKQYDKAETDYNKAIELEPNYADSYYNRGNLFNNLKQYDKAEADYTKAIELKPDDTEAYSNRGNVLYKLKQYDKAEADYTKAIELKLNDTVAYNNRGHLFNNLKQYDKAEMDFTKAIELEPGYAEAYAGRGVLLHKLNRCKEAVADVKKAKELFQRKGNQEGVAFCEGLLKNWDKE